MLVSCTISVGSNTDKSIEDNQLELFVNWNDGIVGNADDLLVYEVCSDDIIKNNLKIQFYIGTLVGVFL
jgi:hypothetical protein